MSRFKGLTYLTNDQYNTLITDGTLTVSGVTINFDPDMLYITPQEESGGVSEEDLNNVINGTTQIIYKNNSFRAGGALDREHSGTISIGKESVVNNTNAIAIGYNALASQSGNVAIGQMARAIAQGTIQIGGGDARTPNRLNVKGWDIFDTENNTLMADGLKVNNIELNGVDLVTQLGDLNTALETILGV